MIEQFLFSARARLAHTARVMLPFAVASVLAGVMAVVPGVGVAQSARPVITSERPGLSALLSAQSFSVSGYSSDPQPVALALEPLDEDPLSGLTPYQASDDALKWQAKKDKLPAGLQVVQSVGVSRHSGPRLGYSTASQGWIDDVGRVTFRQENGSTLSMGQVQNDNEFWGTSARLGGVQFTRLPGQTSRGLLMPGAFGLSAAVGRISNEDLGTSGSGGLTVGGTMASSTMRLGLTPDFTLESHLESGAESSAFGMGGAMAMGDWGALQIATTQNQDALMPTQKSAVGLQLKFEAQQFQSTYETLRSGSLVTEQHFGFKHSWLLSPLTTFQIGGARELMSGTYSMNMQLSVPFDALAAQWWRD